jgi:hypothetical protein
MTKANIVFCKMCNRAHAFGKHVAASETAATRESHAEKILRDRRAQKTAQMKRYRARLKSKQGVLPGRPAAGPASDAATLGSIKRGDE